MPRMLAEHILVQIPLHFQNFHNSIMSLIKNQVSFNEKQNYFFARFLHTIPQYEHIRVPYIHFGKHFPIICKQTRPMVGLVY